MSDVRIRGTALTVDGTAVTSADFPWLLHAVGADAELAFVAPVVTPAADGGTGFAVAGGLTLLGQTVTGATLTVASVAGGAVSRWQLTASLPSLAVGTLKDRGLLAATAGFLPSVLALAPAPVDLTFDSQGRRFYFGAVESAAALADLQHLGVPLTGVGFEYLRSDADNTADFLLRAGLALGSTPLDVSVRIPLDSITPPGTWVVSLDSPINLTAALADVVAFLDATASAALGLSSFGSALPQQLHDLPAVSLQALDLTVDVRAPALRHVTLTVGLTRPLTFGDHLTVSKAGATVSVDLGGAGGANFTVSLFGSMKVGDELLLDLALLLPGDLTQNWTLTADGSLELPDLTHVGGLPMNTAHTDLTLPAGFLQLQSIRLDLLELDFNPAAATVGAVLLKLSVFASCELVHGLTFENPRLEFGVTDPFDSASRKLTGLIAGTILVGDISFGVSAEKSDAGWTFKADAVGPIALGRLTTALVTKFGLDAAAVPAAVAGLQIDTLTLTFVDGPSATGEGTAADLTFVCAGSLPVGSQVVGISLKVHVGKANGAYSWRFDGTVTVGSRTFSLDFSKGATGTYLVAAYTNSANSPIALRELVADVSADVAEYVPADLRVDVKDVWFAYARGAAPAPATFLFGLGLSAHVGLSDLKLVGTFLNGWSADVGDLQVVVASRALTADEAGGLNSLLPTGAGQLPAAGLGQGPTITANATFGTDAKPLTLPAAAPGSAPQAAPPQTVPGVAPSDGASWFRVQRSFGPVSFERVGVKFGGGALTFLLDASLSFAGLTLTLDGLGFGSKLDHFAPTFQLDGLGVDYQKGPLGIGGAFLHTTRTDTSVSPPVTYDEYAGAVVIRTEELSLAAIGAYAYYAGHPSLFVYGVLDYPIGGPAFFFVTGLAAGFGYNRRLTVPGVDQVAQFPLVAVAVSPPPPTSPPPPAMATLQDQVQKLDAYVTPQVGELFLAVGVKFTSFQLLDSFVLLTVAFGDEFELNVLGLSTLIAPTPVPGGSAVTPLAEVQLAVKASFIPAEGFLGVAAQLTSASFVLSRDCHLTGGFAFSTWFAGPHKGDFVVTVGGYHPDFRPPDYYPVVPRLGLSWQVTDELSVKGDMYFALTASALMAGGGLQVNWESGSLRAWLNASADFLVAWKPYHYDARMHVDVGASYTFHFFGTHHITVDVGADLHLWGPEFSGTARVNLHIVSFTISFGQNAGGPQPVSWAEFAASFLPAAADVCSAAVTAGLLAKGDGPALGTINPKELTLTVASVVPSSAAVLPAGVPPVAGSSFGIAPMGLGTAAATLTIDVTRQDGGQAASVGDHFAYRPIRKNVPVALWGGSVSPDLSGPRFVENALVGFELTPKDPAVPGNTATVRRDALADDGHDVPDAFDWGTAPTFRPDPLADAARAAALAASITGAAAARGRILSALGFPADAFDLAGETGAALAADFLVPPQVAAAGAGAVGGRV